MLKVNAFTDKELSLLADFELQLHKIDPKIMGPFSDRKNEIIQLALITNSAPAIQNVGRSWQSLAQKFEHNGIDKIVNQPLKVAVGRAYLAGKLHFFGFIRKLSQQHQELFHFLERIEPFYNAVLFLLLAEDLYITAINEHDKNSPWINRAAMELIQMWETRTSNNQPQFAHDLRQLWQIRKTVVPAFGTMAGTAELMGHLLGMSLSWNMFIGYITNDPEKMSALEEFLFSLSYEQIYSIRCSMREQNVPVIGRADVVKWLKSDDTCFIEDDDETPALNLYRSFLFRKSLAQARRLSRTEGPKLSLEEYFMIYLLKS